MVSPARGVARAPTRSASCGELKPHPPAAGEEPPSRPQAPLNAEVVFMQKGAQKIVHFLTRSAGKRVFFRNRFTRESIEESFPIHDIQVGTPADIHRARLVPGGEELPIQREGGRS